MVKILKFAIRNFDLVSRILKFEGIIIKLIEK